MTTLPTKQNKKLGLVIDLDICVGCHACAVNCKEWNTSGHSSPLHDIDPYGDDPTGVWFNRIHTFEVESEINGSKTVHFPKSCLHCSDAPCVTVCPTGASYKREEDGIVLVNPDTCIGCKLCSWSCPYGAREYDEEADVADWKGMEKRIKNLEDAIADLKSRLSEKDDYSSEETEVELSAKPIKHNHSLSSTLQLSLSHPHASTKAL